MNQIEVKVKKFNDSVPLPLYATPNSVGCDLFAIGLRAIYDGTKQIDIEKLRRSVENGYFVLRPKERALIGTGLYMEIPEGYEMQVRPRSGMSLKKGLMIVNSPGSIDSDYRGEIGVILMNSTNYLIKVHINDAIAQGVFAPVTKATFKEVTDVSETQRGEGGFGHTGNMT